MKHLDLFSGIGGFALAAQQVWGDDYECIGFCDNNKFCQEVLKKRFPGVPIHGDIRTLAADALRDGCYGEQAEVGKEHIEGADGTPSGAEPMEHNTRLRGASAEIDLLTGGFPCQPFSHAGKRRGRSDDRFLWPEMLRVIKEFKPRWVIAENVRGILGIEGGVVFEQVCLGMEKEGYAVQAFIIPACAVNAPHRRDRVWIVAKYTECGNGTRKSTSQGQSEVSESTNQRNEIARNTDIDGRLPRNEEINAAGGGKRQFGGGAGGRLIADGNGTGLERCGNHEERGGERTFRKSDWEEDWRQVALRTCDVRVDDGLPVELYGFKLSKAGHRVERLKALGNAIVPQVAVEIMKAIKEAGKG